MSTMLKFSLFIVLFGLLYSCEDNPTEQIYNSDIVQIQLLDLETNKPLANKEVNIWYLLEKSEMEANTERFTFIPHFYNYKGEINYIADSKANIKITRNNIYNDTLIENIYQADVVAGKHTIDIDFLQFDFGFSEMKLYRNNILTDSISVFSPFRGTMVMEEPIAAQHGNPFLELTTDSNGVIEIDMKTFKYIGCHTRRYSADNAYIGTFKVTNGFRMSTESKNDIIFHIVSLSELSRNKYIWKITE